MDACRGKNCRIKRIRSTYSSCHRWWNKTWRQLISVTNCGGLVFGLKVFPSKSGGCAAGSAGRVQCSSHSSLWVSQPWPHNGPYVWPAAACLALTPPRLYLMHPRSSPLCPLHSWSQCSPSCRSKPKSVAVHPCDSTCGAPEGGGGQTPPARPRRCCLPGEARPTAGNTGAIAASRRGELYVDGIKFDRSGRM